MKKYLLLFLGATSVFYSSCDKSTDADAQILPVIDSIYALATNAQPPVPGYATPKVIQVSYKFEYNAAEMVTRFDVKYDSGSIPYYFTYSGGNLSMITNGNGDTTVISYPSAGVIKIVRSLPASMPTTIVLTNSGNITTVEMENRKAVLSLTSGNMALQKNYFNSILVEELEHEFYADKENPFFYISERVKIPLFLLLHFPYAKFTDLAQYYSRNIFKATKFTSYYGPTPYIKTGHFPDSTYKITSNRVSAIQYPGPTLVSEFGVTNPPSVFFYK